MWGLGVVTKKILGRPRFEAQPFAPVLLPDLESAGSFKKDSGPTQDDSDLYRRHTYHGNVPWDDEPCQDTEGLATDITVAATSTAPPSPMAVSKPQWEQAQPLARGLSLPSNAPVAPTATAAAAAASPSPPPCNNNWQCQPPGWRLDTADATAEVHNIGPVHSPKSPLHPQAEDAALEVVIPCPSPIDSKPPVQQTVQQKVQQQQQNKFGSPWAGYVPVQPLIRHDSYPPSNTLAINVVVCPNAYRDNDAKKLLHAARQSEPRLLVVKFEELSFAQQIGEGGFGKVYYGHLHGQPVAIKLAMLHDADMAQLQQEFAREVSTMSTIPLHPNILRLVAACTDAPNLALVTEYCAGGSLYNVLHSPSILPMPYQQLLSLWLGIACGMSHLHACCVLHRDLKSANLLLDDGGNVKIADFGLSKVYRAAASMELTGGLGTYQWMAPEVLAHQRYSAKADVYSFGIVMWECLTRRLPYSGMTAVQAAVGVVNHGLRPEIPKDITPELAALIKTCWAAVPDQRPSFNEITIMLTQMLHSAAAAAAAAGSSSSSSNSSSCSGHVASEQALKRSLPLPV